MMKIKQLVAKADDDLLDELIKACEGKMASKFKPVEEVKEESEEPEEQEEDTAEELSNDEPSEDDLKKLVELYKSLRS